MLWNSRRASSVHIDRRFGGDDRRAHPRGGRRLEDRVRLALFSLAFGLIGSAAFAQGVQFGVDAKSLSRAQSLGVKVTFASTWAGSWIQKHGWGGVEADLRAAKAAGAVPVIQWWYWGDDISPACLERGCDDKYQGVHKDKATWLKLTNELAVLVERVMGPNSGAIVIPETEFNKHGVETYEPFDGDLVEQARIAHAHGLRVAVGFGNWGREHWKTFNRAAAAADFIGAMSLQSSVRDARTYLDGPDALLSAARYNQATFGKPTFITDVGFSSYPEPSYEQDQDVVVREIFARMSEFREAGVRGIVWRMLIDDPQFDTANYHGAAERHWGLLHADGRPKRAFVPFRDGIAAEAARQEAKPAAAALSASGRR
jgi:hypothetical protein